MNFALILLCGWVFCVSQDLWINKAIKLQIAGRAEKLGRSSSDAEAMVDEKTTINTAIYLCIVFTVFLYGLRFFTTGPGLLLLVVFSSIAVVFIIWEKFRVYREVSEFFDLI